MEAVGDVGLLDSGEAAALLRRRRQERNFGILKYLKEKLTFILASFQVKIDTSMAWNIFAVLYIFSPLSNIQKMLEMKIHYSEAIYLVGFVVFISSLLGIISAMWNGCTQGSTKLFTIISVVGFGTCFFFILRSGDNPTPSSIYGVTSAIGLISMLAYHWAHQCEPMACQEESSYNKVEISLRQH